MLCARLLPVAGWLLLCGSSSAQVLVDWDFSSLQNPGVADAPIAVPLLPAAAANAAAGVLSGGLTGKREDPSYTGLRWATTGAAPGELNLRYFDGDLSDPSGTNNDGISDNYLSFTMVPSGGPLQVTRITVSAWRNGAGAPGTYAIEIVQDGGSPQAFGAPVQDANTGDGVFDEFAFDGDVTAQSSLEVRFRPVASAGGLGTGNLHIDGLRVEGGDPAPLADGPKVLFLIADDLTAEALGCYGNPDVHTPNIDALANRGMVFDRAYTQYPVCDASRASMMTGWYTARIQAQGGSFGSFDGALGEHSTLPEHFRLNGYTSSRVSKLYHMRVPGDITSGSSGPDHPPSWDSTVNVLAPEWMTPGTAGHYTNETLNFDPNQHYGLGFGAAFYAVEASTSGVEQADWLAASAAIGLLEAHQDEALFLGVGFVRPHVPLVAPASAFALYDPAQLPLADSVPGDLLDIPSQGVFWNEPSRGPNTDADRRSVLEAYYASVTFMDEQVGRVLTRLEELELDDDTIVVFTSDHGYHLGEHTMWQKLSLHEESARVPLIIAGPGLDSGRTETLAELLDLYPTLAELAGLPIPAGCQGISLAGVLNGAPDAGRAAAYTRVGAGHLLRTAEWAYMRYSNGGEELYDMRSAPLGDPLQFTNLVSDPTYASVLQELRALLDAKLLAVVADSGSPYCFGDGSGAVCPCFAYGQPGEGCLTTSGSGARLAGGGSADLSSDSFALTVSGGPPLQAGLLFQGTQVASTPLGDGILCTTPSFRHDLKPLDEDGAVRYTGLGVQAAAGVTYRYQYYFRDVTAPCGAGFNFTNGWQVTWN